MEMLPPEIALPLTMVRIVAGTDCLEPHTLPFLQGRVALFSAQAPGKTTGNEDAAALISIDRQSGLIVVADGLGGHADGALASRMAIDALVDATRDVVAGGGLREAVLRGIDAAEEFILFKFFIVHDDEIGREVKAHLVERAQAGVNVFFLYDEVGSHDLPRAYSPVNVFGQIKGDSSLLKQVSNGDPVRVSKA